MDKWRKIAEENGINSINYNNRINKLGWTAEKAALTPLKSKKLNKELVAIAKENGISYGVYRDRVNKLGWTENKAAITPLKQKRDDTKWIEKALRNGISRNAYIDRVDERFWSPEDASTIPPMDVEKRVSMARSAKTEYADIRQERVYNDENNFFTVVPQHYEIAEKNGISKGAVKSRVYGLGWTVQKAITEPLMKADFERPKEYYDYLEKAKSNGITNATYYSRIRRGWSPEEAATKELIKPQDFKRRDKKWMELAVENGISARTYRGRVYNGWTEEEAATTKILKTGEYLNDERREKARAGFRIFRGIKEDDST